MAENLSSEMAEAGFSIVSGMARGIDSIVHKTAIKSRGTTIAVLGAGIDVIYPPENRSLYEEIANTG
ncbi:Rossmann fold nucleotide-binding protein Smf [Paenibacillus sp. JCM 10914]|nr:Rossmann fold nucleotide-binding protein Smf [Paenibacillus sp. JCM 10914]